MLTTMNDDAKTGRLSAAERRNELIEAAIHEFAINGLAGSSTEAISAKVGVSQPYIFKLFGTKKSCFWQLTSGLSPVWKKRWTQQQRRTRKTRRVQ